MLTYRHRPSIYPTTKTRREWQTNDCSVNISVMYTLRTVSVSRRHTRWRHHVKQTIHKMGSLWHEMKHEKLWKLVGSNKYVVCCHCWRIQIIPSQGKKPDLIVIGTGTNLLFSVRHDPPGLVVVCWGAYPLPIPPDSPGPCWTRVGCCCLVSSVSSSCFDWFVCLFLCVRVCYVHSASLLHNFGDGRNTVLDIFVLLSTFSTCFHWFRYTILVFFFALKIDLSICY